MFQFIFILGLSFTPNNMKIRVQKQSTWLAYNMKNIDDMHSHIPKGTEIVPMRILSADIAAPKLLFNVYESVSPFFRGVRLEVVTMVRQIQTPRKVHFVVLECLTNTIQWDPCNGIQWPNADASFCSHAKQHHVSCTGEDGFLSLHGTIGRSKAITKMFAIDANYLCFYRNSPYAITLKFEESEIMRDVNLFSNLKVETNLWEKNRGVMTHAFLHPHSMDFIAGLQKTNLT